MPHNSPRALLALEVERACPFHLSLSPSCAVCSACDEQHSAAGREVARSYTLTCDVGLQGHAMNPHTMCSVEEPAGTFG